MTFKNAFTLAEVLITLGIIGVVAAITIPGLINTHKAQRLRSQFLKSYSTIQQVFKQMEADDVSLNPADYNDRNYGRFYKTFNNYLKGSLDCGDLTRRNQTSLCYNYSTNTTDKPYKTLDGSNTITTSLFDDGQILLSDGTLLLFENPSNIPTPYVWIHVDLNGYKTPPNRWGYDLFTFQFLDGELRTMGDVQTNYKNHDTYCNISSTHASNGISCANKAKTDTEYFKALVKKIK